MAIRKTNVSLNSIWRKITRARRLIEKANEEFKAIYGDSYFGLVSSYNLNQLVEKAKDRLIGFAVYRVLEKYGITNIKVEDKDVLELSEGDFDEEKIEEYMVEKYVKNADEIAFSQMLHRIVYLLPVLPKPATSKDILNGRKLILRVRWDVWDKNLTHESIGAIRTLEKIIKVVLGGERASTVSDMGIAEMIKSFRTIMKPYNQARTYEINNDYIEKIRIYKNGKLEITFKMRRYAYKIAKTLTLEDNEPDVLSFSK